MAIKDIMPVNDPTRFIPDALLNETIYNDEIVIQAVNKISNRMSLEEYIQYVQGAVNLHKICADSDTRRAKGEKIPKGETRMTWFTTGEVEDVRVFYRTSNDDPNKAIGAKVRLYSLGRERDADEDDDDVVQGIDTGFLHYNFYRKSQDMAWQSALASTMLYKSLYSIGGPASIRKLNEAATDADAVTYKSLTAIRPSWSDNVDRGSYKHILHAAALKAGVDDPLEFYGKKFLDDFEDALFNSKDINELKEAMKVMGDVELFDEEIETIIKESNQFAGDVSDPANPKRGFKKESQHPGINVVLTLEYIRDILEEDR